MKFVYKPEGVEPRKWEFDPTKMLSPEMMAIERLTGMTYGEWVDATSRSSVLALHALLYVFMKRDRPTLKPEEVQFTLEDIDLEEDEPAPKASKKAATPPSGSAT